MVKATKAHRWIGLDIGSTSIKVVVVEQPPVGPPRFVRHLIHALPIAAEAQAVDRAGWLQSALNAIGAKEVHAVVGGPEVLLRRMSLPLMSAKERAEAVRWQLKDEVPFPIQQAIVDVQVLSEVWDKDVKKHDVLAVIASAEVVRGLMTLVECSGARVVSVSSSLLAMCRCAAQVVPEASTGSVAVIEVGASDTHVALMKDGRVRVTRDLPVGSAHLTESLVGVVNTDHGDVTIDHLAAETLKRHYGVLGDAAEGQTEEGVPLFHLSSLMRPVLEQLVTEVSRFFDFYTVQMNEAGISRVLLCGGGAMLRSLPAFLAEGLGVTVELFNPLIRLADRPVPLEPEQVAQDGPRLAAALGAAFEHGQGLSVLPKEIRQGRDAAVAHRVWRVGAYAVAGLVAAAAISLHAMAMTLTTRLRAREAVWAQAEPAYQRARAAIARSRQMEIASGQVEAFLNQQPVWAGVLKELGRLTPPTVQLEELALSREDTALAEYRFQVLASLVGGASQDDSIAQWMEEMERSAFFARVRMVSAEMHSTAAGQTHVELEGTLE